MSAPRGNSFWEVRSSHGRNPIFQTPEQLWSAALEYFAWVEANPLIEQRLVSFKGQSKLEDVPHMRAKSIMGLCVFLDIVQQTWANYREREGFLEVCQRIETIIRQQKFEGAAADLLNAAIIARDLGMADKHQLGGDPDNKTPLPVLFELVPLQPAEPEKVTAPIESVPEGGHA